MSEVSELSEAAAVSARVRMLIEGVRAALPSTEADGDDVLVLDRDKSVIALRRMAAQLLEAAERLERTQLWPERAPAEETIADDYQAAPDRWKAEPREVQNKRI